MASPIGLLTRPGARSHARVWFERAVVIGISVALVIYLLDHWEQVRDYPWVLRVDRLLIATALAIGVYSGFVLLWRRLLIAMGGQLSLADAHRVWYLGNLGRYVPGKVVQIAGTAYLASAKGVRPMISITASALSQVYVIATAIAVAVVGLGPAWLPGLSPSVSLVLGLVALALLVSPVFDAAARTALRWTDRSRTAEPVPSLGIGERVSLAIGYLTCWLVFGVAFRFFVTAVIDVPGRASLEWIGIHAAAYAAGWLAIFAPGGIGVREGAYAVLLAPFVPAATGAAVAILSRLWLTACELGVTALLLARYGYGDLSVASQGERAS